MLKWEKLLSSKVKKEIVFIIKKLELEKVWTIMVIWEKVCFKKNWNGKKCVL